jgi:sortase (surface protein transpeptidase)
MPRKKHAAWLVLGAGLIVAGVGAAGLAQTRQPVTAQYGAAPTLPAPTGPVVAAPRQGPAEVSLPVALTIPSIGVQTSLIRLGLTASGALQVPPSTAVAGWYTGSPRPGALGSSVIAGHIDSYLGPGVFYRLRLLRPGNKIYVRQADGRLATFRVTAVRQYPKAHFPTARVYGPTPDAELHLITCGGVFDAATGTYLSNVVVFSTEVR